MTDPDRVAYSRWQLLSASFLSLLFPFKAFPVFFSILCKILSFVNQFLLL